jgi:voltage-dependent potassium channel beta subunit
MAEQKVGAADDYKMEYRMMGGTGLQVSVLGLGTMSFNSVAMAEELMSAVRSYGVNFFDSAELYGIPYHGQSEEYLGTALKNLQKKDPKLWRRSDLVITTKLFFNPGLCKHPQAADTMFKVGPNDIGTSRKHILEGINASLKRLQLDYVDIVFAHRFDPLTPMEETVRGFTDVIRAGKAFYWGTSCWTSQKLTEAYWVAKMNNLIPPVVEQPQYSMLSRYQMELDLLPMFEAPYKMGTTTWSPLEWGILTGKYVKETKDDTRFGKNSDLKGWASWMEIGDKNAKVAKLMEIAAELKVSMPALALAWVIKNKNVSVCLLGGTKASQLLQNKDAVTVAKMLNEDIMKRIEEIVDSKPKPDSVYLGNIRPIKNAM